MIRPDLAELCAVENVKDLLLLDGRHPDRLVLVNGDGSEPRLVVCPTQLIRGCRIGVAALRKQLEGVIDGCPLQARQSAELRCLRFDAGKLTCEFLLLRPGYIVGDNAVHGSLSPANSIPPDPIFAAFESVEFDGDSVGSRVEVDQQIAAQIFDRQSGQLESPDVDNSLFNQVCRQITQPAFRTARVTA